MQRGLHDACEVEELCNPATVLGENLVTVTLEMGCISKSILGKKLDNLPVEATEIMNAIDLLLMGFDLL